MNGICSNLYKYSAIALPLISLGLVQLIQGFDPKWGQNQHHQLHSDIPSYESNAEQEQRYYDYYRNYYDSLNNAQGNGRSSLKNVTSRDYTPADDSKTLPDIPKPVYGAGIVAYRRSLHNTSWAVTIPLFTFLLPIAGSGDPVSLQNQALYGFFSALIVIIGFAVPILFNGKVPKGSRSLENSRATLNHLMHPGHMANLFGVSMQNQLGVDPFECLQKTICEAYRSPQNEKYGMLAWPVRYFFPANNISDENTASIYDIAARDGKFTDTKCGKKYGCIFDVLDLANYLLTVYKQSRKDVKRKGMFEGNYESTNSLNDYFKDKRSG